jgi:hypothetical protein
MMMTGPAVYVIASKLKPFCVAPCSKAEQDIARLLSRQQRMDGDVKKLRDLIDDLRSDLKSARDAQVYSHRCICYQLPRDRQVSCRASSGTWACFNPKCVAVGVPTDG